MIACLRNLGCDLEELDFVEGFDVIMCNMRTFIPRVCSIREFYPKLFPKEPELKFTPKPLEAGLSYNHNSRRPFGSNIQTAEQYMMLANAGLANYKPKVKHG